VISQSAVMENYELYHLGTIILFYAEI